MIEAALGKEVFSGMTLGNGSLMLADLKRSSFIGSFATEESGQKSCVTPTGVIQNGLFSSRES